FVIAGGQPAQELHALHDGPEILDHRAESAEESGLLPLLAAVERNALRVFPQPDQAEAEIRLEALAVEVEPDQWPPDLEGQPGADERIEQPDPNQISGNVDLAPASQRDRD